MDELKFIFFGVRGSYPVSDKKFIKYGGNTTSVLFDTGDDIFIIDGGTGIIHAGEYIQKRNNIKKINIFLTHLHNDHIMGLPFFNPLYKKDMVINIYCFKYNGLEYSDVIYSLFNQPLSPISKKGILAGLNFHTIDETSSGNFKINENTSVKFIKNNSHPKSGVLIYRVDFFSRKIVFATDIESGEVFSGEHDSFIRDSDILIHDAQYTSADYYNPDNPKTGYGHSTVDMAVRNAVSLNVGKLFLFHYSPEYSDNKLEKIYGYAKKKFRNTYLSRENMTNKIRR